jgi:hypothetical protein
MSEAVILMIAQYALRYGPDAAKALKDIFTSKDPTEAQWDALWSKSQTPYADFVSGAAK